MTFEFYQFKSVKFGRCDRTKKEGMVKLYWFILGIISQQDSTPSM